LGAPGTGVLITGGGSGIGRATALALAEVGRPVSIWDINGDGAEETASLCAAAGVVSEWAVVDVADSAAIAEAVPKSVRALGAIGGFVHAAGVGGPMSVDFIDDELWDSVLDINVRGGVMIARSLIGPFQAAGPGSAMVFISSIEGLFGSAMLTAYCASKGGVLGVMRSIGHRMAADGVRVNAVCPGPWPHRCSFPHLSCLVSASRSRIELPCGGSRCPRRSHGPFASFSRTRPRSSPVPIWSSTGE
jgi:NAD(P)-dependent dehydrogenase (short-subunit alcohol dehydrogenase family)